MTDIFVKVAVFAVLMMFVAVCSLWQKPRTPSGKLALKLCLINVISWVIVLPLDDEGHPPPRVMAGALLWLLNLPVLVALIAALSVSFRSREENVVYLTIITIYVALNVALLCILPAFLLIWSLI